MTPADAARLREIEEREKAARDQLVIDVLSHHSMSRTAMARSIITLRAEVARLEESLFSITKRLGERTNEVARLRGALDGRAGKLLIKEKPFLVVANDEPYYGRVYSMIRDREIEIGRWTEDDEDAYRAALGEKGEA